MIASLAPQSHVARATSLQPAPQPPAPQPPAQQPPADGIDLSSLDCPYKVAQLPIFEPAFQLGLATAAAVAISSAFGGGQQPSIQLALASFVGDTNFIGTSYTVDINNQEAPIKAEGNLVSATNVGEISGSLGNYQNETVQWNGSFGANPESLSFSMDESTPTPELLINGTIGTVPTSLRLSIIGNADDGLASIKGYQVNGTIGDLPYHTETHWALNEDLFTGQPPSPDQTVNMGTMTTRGTIGERQICKDYEVTAEVDVNNETGIFHVLGEGVNADVPQFVAADLAIGRALPTMGPAI